MNKLTRHHRKPKSLGGTTERKNVSKIPHKKHVAWHVLFGNAPAHRIAEEINRYYIDPDYRLVIERRSP